MPLLSDSGVAAIGHLLGANCELLPWVVEPLHRYRIVHVLTKIPRECWSCEESSSYGEQISSADIISLRLFEVPPIFTLDGFRGRVFVSDRVARQSVEAGLTGDLFVDPRVRALHVPFIQRRRKVKLSGFIRVEDDL